MANGKHRITKERAEKLLDGMKAKIANPGNPLSGFPEGFIFDIEAVRKLLSHPEAAHFIIRFGWKEEDNQIAPILCVADAGKKILEQGGRRKTSANTRGLRVNPPDDDGTGEEAGGFLDEGTKHP